MIAVLGADTTAAVVSGARTAIMAVFPRSPSSGLRLLPALACGAARGRRHRVSTVTRTNPDRVAISDPAVMRAMAHPARLAILDYLADGTEATATECARVCGLSPSATSYHLRELAKAALIEEAPQRGDGRERVWHRIRPSLTVNTSGAPEADQAALNLINAVLDRDEAQARQWFARAAEESGPWADAAALIRLQLLLTAAELTELTARMSALVTEYTGRNRREAPEGARRVSMLIRAVPVDDAGQAHDQPAKEDRP